MQGNLVITIGRDAGSGGKAIGMILAKELGIKCYDKELLALAAKDSGIHEELFEAYDEKPRSSFLYSLVMDTYSLGYTPSGYADVPMTSKIFLAQFNTIKKLAERESCIIVGRCGDYALEDYPGAVRVFLTGNEEDQIAHVSEVYEVPLSKAKDLRKKINKQRSSYYNYYTSKRWGDSRSYDLTLNTSVVGYEGAAKLIREFAEVKRQFKME